MPRTRNLLLLLAALLSASCRSEAPSRASAAPPIAHPSASSVATASAPSSAPAAPAWPAKLAKLKPVISKPFPEGADEATVCEAIDSKEPDLWLRFGHILPVFYQGAVYVLETGPQNKDKLYDFVANKYTYGYDSRQASCRGQLTLLYIRNMYETSEFNGKPFGREHLSRQLKEKLGIATTESFLFKPDEQRLSEYCRADASLCDSLVKLDSPNKGEGLCTKALTHCSLQRGTDTHSSALLAACRKLPASLLACLAYRGSLAESFLCREQVIASLCP